MRRGPGARAGGAGRRGAGPREPTRPSAHRPGRLGATQPRTAAATGACSHTGRAADAQQAGASLLPSAPSPSAPAPRPLLSPPPPPGARSGASLRLSSQPGTPLQARGELAPSPSLWGEGGGGTAGPGAGRPRWPARAAAASGWAPPPPPAPADSLWLPAALLPALPGLPHAPTAPGSARPQGPGGALGVEGDPDLRPQGGFHPWKGLMDQGRIPESDTKRWPSYATNTVTISGAHEMVFLSLYFI